MVISKDKLHHPVIKPVWISNMEVKWVVICNISLIQTSDNGILISINAVQCSFTTLWVAHTLMLLVYHWYLQKHYTVLSMTTYSAVKSMWGEGRRETDHSCNYPYTHYHTSWDSPWTPCSSADQTASCLVLQQPPSHLSLSSNFERECQTRATENIIVTWSLHHVMAQPNPPRQLIGYFNFF